MTIQAFPLHWPAAWPRTNPSNRKRAQFKKGERQYSQTPGMGSWMSHKRLTVADGRQRVIESLERMGARNMIISSNLALRLDGLPRSGQSEPIDVGVAVYWNDARTDGWPQRCMAIDRYDTVADNLAAIAATLEALRSIERYGGGRIMDRAFTGFTALPPAGATNWRDVLGVSAERPTRDQIELAYRQARSAAHPDKGGDADKFRAVESAYAAAPREIGA